MIRIAFDAGHGIDTWDKVNHTGSKGIGDFAEFDFNSATVRKAKALAETNGFEVILTQPLDGKDVRLSTRTNMAYQQGAKVLISFHADANDNVNAKGHYAFYWYANAQAKNLAQIWAKYSAQIMKNPARGDNGTEASVPDTWTDFHMCREPHNVGMTAILIEHAFFTNDEERDLLKSDDFQDRCAETIVRALCEYFGVEYKEKEVTPVTTSELSWQQKQGLSAVAYLASIGKINSPDDWTAEKMNEAAPTWLIMALIARSNGMK